MVPNCDFNDVKGRVSIKGATAQVIDWDATSGWRTLKGLVDKAAEDLMDRLRPDATDDWQYEVRVTLDASFKDLPLVTDNAWDLVLDFIRGKKKIAMTVKVLFADPTPRDPPEESQLKAALGDPAITPELQQMLVRQTEALKALDARWPPCDCQLRVIGARCWIDQTGKHRDLDLQLRMRWASAMLDGSANTDVPPTKVLNYSPYKQARQQAQAASAAASSPTPVRTRGPDVTPGTSTASIDPGSIKLSQEQPKGPPMSVREYVNTFRPAYSAFVSKLENRSYYDMTHLEYVDRSGKLPQRLLTNGQPDEPLIELAQSWVEHWRTLKPEDVKKTPASGPHREAPRFYTPRTPTPWAEGPSASQPLVFNSQTAQRSSPSAASDTEEEVVMITRP